MSPRRTMRGAGIGRSVLLVATTLLCACAEDPPPAPPAASAPQTTARPSAPSVVRPEPYAEERLPDEADYAAEAEREITGENYADKLEEIGRQLDPKGTAAAGEGDAGVEASPGRDGGATAAEPPPRDPARPAKPAR